MLNGESTDCSIRIRGIWSLDRYQAIRRVYVFAFVCHRRYAARRELYSAYLLHFELVALGGYHRELKYVEMRVF